MIEYKFTFTNTIVIGIVLTFIGVIFGMMTGNYEIMYGGIGLLTARTGIKAYSDVNLNKSLNEK